ncbi:MAG TPA: hypothetical protein VGQ50_15200 [Actinomycetota bacterium]|nr:hypothetical protein [Actinomycetota bacterium]
MGRRLRIGIGVALVVLGLFATVGGVALVSLVGADGSIGLAPTRLIGSGYAITLPQVDVPSLPDGQHVRLDVSLQPGDRPLFLGIGPTSDVNAYLRDVPIDVIEQIDQPGAASTSPINGNAQPAAPEAQPFWAISATGDAPSISWTAQPGEWTLVVMSTPPRRPVNVTASGSVTLPVLGPLGFVLLAIAVAVLGAGAWMIVRAARTRASAS